MHEHEETEVLTKEHLKNITAEKLLEIKLYPRKALKLLEFEYLTNKYYQQVMDEKKPQQKKQKSYLAVFRHENSTWRMDLEKEEFQLLKKLFTKMKIGEALANDQKTSPALVKQWFSKWINNGLLAAHNY